VKALLLLALALPARAQLAPVITSLNPNTAQAGGAGFTLIVNGANFDGTASVRWNGSARATTFVNATAVTATIPASDIAAAGAVAVTVNTALGGTSAPATFTITPAPAPPPPGSAPTQPPKAFPNPARAGTASVTFSNLATGGSVDIFGFDGRKLRSLTAANGQARWDLTNGGGQRVASGVYVYIIRDGQGGSVKGKIALLR
jgi:hypothetical protein